MNKIDFDLLMKSLSKNLQDEESNKNLQITENKLECKLCGKQFLKRSNMERHINTVHASKQVFNCDDCDFKTNHERKLKSHVVSIHLERKAKCHICDKIVSVEYLNKHIQLIHKTSSHVCPKCKKEFENEIYLKNHIRRIHEQRQILHCDICNFQSKGEESLISHKIRRHNDFEERKMIYKRKYQCKVCDFTVGKKLYLELHNSREHDIKIVCDDCGFQADTNDSLKKHKPVHKLELSYNCSLCSYKSNVEANLKLHWKSRHKIRNEIKCNECDVVYYSKESLRQHTGTVHRHLKYKCDICQYEATQATHLISHKKSIHEGVKHPCNICGKEFSQKSHMRTHRDTVHLKQTKLECKQCDYKAYHSNHLKNHINAIHLGIKYSCNECDHQATQKSSLKAHMRRIHSIGELKCNCCSATFLKEQYRRKHISEVHGDEYLERRDKHSFMSPQNAFEKSQISAKLESIKQENLLLQIQHHLER